MTQKIVRSLDSGQHTMNCASCALLIGWYKVESGTVLIGMIECMHMVQMY